MEKTLLFAVACSNGKKSDAALTLCLNHLMKIEDKVNALHIYDPEIGKNTALERSVHASLLSTVNPIQVPSCKFNLIWERKTHKHLIVQILKFIYQCQCQYLLLGFSQNDVFMATLLEKSSSSLIIMKSEYLNIGPKNWVICLDNSSHSFSSVHKITQLMKPNDNLCFIHVKKSENENFSNTQIESLYPNAPFYSIENLSDSIHESILIFIQERSIRAHFLVVSAYGETAEQNGNKIVGKVSKNIVKFTNSTNVIVLR